MPNKKLFTTIMVFAVIAVAGIWVGSKFFGRSSDPAGPSEYSAVYMSSGDIYYGKLSWFPWPRLTNVWFLQRSVNQQNQPQFGLVPFKTAFWGPVDEIYLNPKEIVLWTSIRNDSQVAKAFLNPASLQQVPVQQPNGTFQGPSGPPPGGH